MSYVLCKQNISRLMALLLAVTLLLACAPAASAAGGSCGGDLHWSFDGSTLTISGRGAMTDFSGGTAPWYDVRESILRVSLPGGLTHIGEAAFYDCINLGAVSLPASVESIGEAAFYRCTGMTMLSLNNGLRSIGRKAFLQCSALTDLRLPATLNSIGNYAFYLCEGLTYVTVPSSVTEFGSGVFAYCDSLIRVDVEAAVELPGWSFYGCDQLQTVTVQGSSLNPESLKVTTPADAPQQTTPSQTPAVTPSVPAAVPGVPAVTPAAPPVPVETEPPAPAPETGTASSGQLITDESGNQMLGLTTVQKTDNSTTVSSIQTPVEQPGDLQTSISSTVQNPEGWQDVLDQVDQALPNQDGKPLDVMVYAPESDVIEKEVLQELAGKNVSLTVQTQSGSKFTLDCAKLPEKVKRDLALTYSLTLMEDVPAGMEGCTVYQLTFEKSADIQAEVVMRLPGNHNFQTATLYRMDKKDPVQLQSVLVDDSGNAHWYLRSIDHKQTYLIGINIPGAVTESPIIPAELAGVYKVANVYDGVEYVVTGRTSSWNMGLGQVMAILAVVMVSAIVVVGFVMYSLNKRRLKNGYVPQWLDEDEE